MKEKLFSFLTSKLSWNLNVLEYVMNLQQENWKCIISQTYLILDPFKNAYMVYSL